jgi:hypothetical protein
MPKETQIQAKAPKVDKEATISVTCFGETIEEDLQLVGADVVKSNYEANVIITIQGAIRRMLGAGSEVADIQGALKDYKPGQAVRRGVVDVKAGYKAYFASLSAEEKKAELAALRAAAG